MSEVQRYYLSAAGHLIEGEELGRLGVYLAADYDQLKEQLWHSEMAAEAEAHLADGLKAERDQLKEELHQYRLTSGGAIAENSTLRRQLLEAKLLLTSINKQMPTPIIDAWLEANNK